MSTLTFSPTVCAPEQAEPAWLNAANRFIIDLDGTLIREKTLTGGAQELLRRLAGRYVIVSNNSTDTAVGLARKLGWLGLKVEARQLILAGETTVHLLAEHYARARILLLASPILRHYARQLGCHLVEQDAELVVLARDKAFNYRRLASAANAVHRGATLIATNPDLYHPAPGDGLVPETGALLQAVSACAGVSAHAVIGKPGAALFERGLARLGCAARDTIVIGDNPATDALGAVRHGMRYLLVGASRDADAACPGDLLHKYCDAHSNLPGERGE